MSLDTYANLKTAIADYLDRAAADLALDDYIDLVEADINKRLRVPEMIKRATATMPTTGRFLAVPAGYIEMKKLRLDTDPTTLLEYVGPSQIETYYRTGSGRPAFFTVVGDELEFNRASDSAYTIQMHYYKQITALDGTNTSNDILTYYPGIYLFGALKFAAPYLRDNNDLQVYSGLYEQALEEANLAARNDQYNGAPLQMRTDYQ